jgi:hypothetical protein
MKLLVPGQFREDQTMAQKNEESNFVFRKVGYAAFLLAALLIPVVTFAIPADDRKVETIDATTMGTSTQLGQNVSVKMTIYDFSTEEDRAILVEAFKQGKQQGLVNVRTKMKSVGRIAITSTRWSSTRRGRSSFSCMRTPGNSST